MGSSLRRRRRRATARGGYLFACAVLFTSILLPVALRGQSAGTCKAPPLLLPKFNQKLLSPKQEAEWSQILSAQLAWDDKPFSVPGLAAYPDAILSRLLENAPAGAGLRPQVHFYNATYPNAFVMFGGQIYISRQIAAYLHSESDLAALLAHETGHALAHQQELEFSESVRQLLGENSLSGQESVLEIHSRLIDKTLSNLKAAREWARQEAKREQPDQEAADRNALYLLASAGYPPQAMERLFEHIVRTHQKTGSWLTDLFGLTTPDEKRLRALQESIAQLPAPCRTQGPPAPVGNFAAWRAALISFDRPTGAENLSGLLRKGRLQPGLAGPVDQIRFSPDGRYLLLHSPSGVTVYTTNPLAFQFRLNVPGATYVNFSPDSQAVIFHTKGLRVERWNIASRKRVSLHMVVPLNSCWEEMDSPDGRLMAVLGCEGNFSILEESTGAKVFSKKINGLWGPGAFSPDGRYFVAGHYKFLMQDAGAIAVDLKTGKEISLPGMLGREIGDSKEIVFLGPDRLAIYGTPFEQGEIYMVSFPGGKFIKSVKFSLQKPGTNAGKKKKHRRPQEQTDFPGLPRKIEALTKADDDLLLTPFRKYAALLLDMVHGRFITAFRSPAVDVFGDLFAERLRGELRIVQLDTGNIQAAADLPPGLLGTVTEAAVSPDLKWLAISGPQEGGIFRLANGAVMDETQTFTGAWFGKDDALYADFLPTTGGVATGPSAGSFVKRFNLDKSAPPFQLKTGADESQYGPFLLTFRKARKKGKPTDRTEFEVRSLPGHNLLWKRSLPEEPSTVTLSPGGKLLLLGWPIWPQFPFGLLTHFSPTPKDTRHYLGIDKKYTGYAFQIFDAKTGKLRGKFLLPGLTDLVDLQEADAVGEEIVVSDGPQRTRAYSWKTGKPEGLALGQALAVSPGGRFVCLAITPRELAVARLPSLTRESAALKFPRTVSLARFSQDGRHLFVLTRDQRFFIFDASKLEAQAGPAHE